MSPDDEGYQLRDVELLVELQPNLDEVKATLTKRGLIIDSVGISADWGSAHSDLDEVDPKLIVEAMIEGLYQGMDEWDLYEEHVISKYVQDLILYARSATTTTK